MNNVSLRKAVEEATSNTSYANVFKDKPTFPPNGYAFFTLAWALYWLYNSDSFEEAVINAVNRGGDADTIASLVGGLARLYYGFADIPSALKVNLRDKHNMSVLALEIFTKRLNQL